MQTLFLVFSFMFGAAIGSFLNVVILRLPENHKLTGRSHCPHCHRRLPAWELIPLLSFALLGGKCAGCGKQISIRYFTIEMLTAVLFAAAVSYVEPQNLFGLLMLAKFWLLLSGMIVVFVIDLEHYLILDKVIFPLAVVGLAINFGLDISAHQQIFFWSSITVNSILAGLGAMLPFFVIWSVSRGRWMGFGDVKLAFLLGVCLGWPLVGVSIFSGILLGGLISLGLLVFTKKTLKSQLPFGTFLSLGTILALFYGEKILHWYLAILGF